MPVLPNDKKEEVMRFILSIIVICFFLSATGCSKKVESIEIINDKLQRIADIYSKEIMHKGYNNDVLIEPSKPAGSSRKEWFWYDVTLTIPSFQNLSYDKQLELLKFIHTIAVKLNKPTKRADTKIWHTAKITGSGQ